MDRATADRVVRRDSRSPSRRSTSCARSECPSSNSRRAPVLRCDRPACARPPRARVPSACARNRPPPPARARLRAQTAAGAIAGRREAPRRAAHACGRARRAAPGDEPHPKPAQADAAGLSCYPAASPPRNPTAHGWPRQPRVCRAWYCHVLAVRRGGYGSTWSSTDCQARPSVRGGTVSTESALRAARGRTGGGVADNATQHAHVAQRRPHTPVSTRYLSFPLW